MISKEVAQERLKTFRSPNSSTEQVARLEKLSANLSIIGQILIQAGPEWEKLQKDQKKSESRKYSVEQIKNLNPKNRMYLFNALFPGIAAYVEAAWELFDIFPYQSGHQRRPFRNPRQFSLETRISWLQQLPHAVGGYEHQDVVWFASWAPHLGFWGPDMLGYLFAAAIQAGGKTGDEVFNILVSSANGSHEIGAMGRHVVRGLLCSSRQEGWEYIERMLLAAQREEGLRQVIFEAVDEAHPQAFRRILRVIVDNNLLRFSAVIRACAVWLGLPLEVANQKSVNNILIQILHYLESTPNCEKAIHSNDAQDAYYALWAMAFDNVSVALPHAISMSHSSSVDMRFTAVHFLSQTKLKEALPELLRALDDDDLRIPARVLTSLNRWDYDETLLAKSDLFERLERLLPRIKHKENNLKPIAWDWMPISLERETVVEKLIDCIGNRSPKRLFQYVDIMSVRSRDRVARVLKEVKQKDREILHMLLSFTGDASPSVREEAFKGLNGVALDEMDIITLEELLSRQAQDLRRGVIQLLMGLDDKRLFESIARLSAHKGEKMRLAALELLRECKQKRRNLQQVRTLTLIYQQRQILSAAETRLLNELAAEAVENYSLENALGLMDPHNRTKPVPVKARKSNIKLISPAALACLKSLDTLIEQHRNDVIEIHRGNVKSTELLGNVQGGWMLYADNYRHQGRNYSEFPLREMAEAWWKSRSNELHDTDGNELIRAKVAESLLGKSGGYYYFFQPLEKELPDDIQAHFGVHLDFSLNYEGIVSSIIDWLIWAHPAEYETDFILGALEESIGRIPYKELTGLKNEYYGDRKVRALDHRKIVYLDIARWQRDVRSSTWMDGHHARLWSVVRWLDEPAPNLPGGYATLDDALFAFQVGAATRDDLFAMFMGNRKVDEWNFYRGGFNFLYQFSTRKPHPQELAQMKKFPVIKEIVDACRERILDVECRRGELSTAATGPAGNIRSVPGMRNLFRLLVALGDSGFDRGHGFGRHSDRSRVLSHLIRNTYPIEGDTVQEFAEQVKTHQIPEKILIDLAVYAPQWVDFIQLAIGWDHLNDAVWWLYAHTKDRQWTADEMRDEWAARISERTPLTAGDLMDGAVDVAWFRKMYDEIGEERWKKLYDAALYASGGIGHTRARLFADAMLGRITVEKETERIRKKRNQDSIRALGLVPIDSAKKQKSEVLNRYAVMQEFLRTGKKFGSQRKASEKLAVSIGLQNLARTAGYSDPQRLEWAMEVESIADLSSGTIKIQVGEFQILLSINDLGEPVLEFRKKDKPIKTIPSGIKKNERVTELLERKQQLDRQVSRMRLSLEQAMCRGDEFTVSELKMFFRHPMLKVMIEQLVFVSANGLGYPIRAGKELFLLDGTESQLANADRVRIAHPLDLLESKKWHLWQHECFVAERIQPFKQVFRELYVLTAAEKDEGNLSRRYAGHQVNPRQAVALFGGRGWVADPNEGVRKTFHEAGISARVGFLYDLYTPAEVEGSTIETVAFTKRSEWNPLKLEEISPLIFSEVMRDLDLVVSVAHAGGVDPEASASSIEARGALIRETSALLNLTNIQISERHVIVDGKLSNYNVNLGSGVVHKQPGGALCIIPVHSQHRGRIFLPFVDNDPKTAEIVSKVVLLARDDQIKDPTILEQIL